MNFEDIATDSKWNLLKELAKGKKSASDLAKKTGTSVANATVQLKLLEAKGIVKKVKAESATKRPAGKPKTPFELHEEILLTGVLKKGMAERKIARVRDLGDYQRFALTTLLSLDSDEAYAVQRFAMETDILKKGDCISLLKTHQNEIELFLIIEEDLEAFRKKYSNMSIELLSGKHKKVITWSHTKKEVDEGIARQEEYFKNLILATELLDKKGMLREWNQ
jgi:DNA-binding Lrp family transcriptional regulator